MFDNRSTVCQTLFFATMNCVSFGNVTLVNNIVMDYPLPYNKKNKIRFFQPFHYLDLIPYSMAALMLAGSIYILFAAIEITKHVK